MKISKLVLTVAVISFSAGIASAQRDYDPHNDRANQVRHNNNGKTLFEIFGIKKLFKKSRKKRADSPTQNIRPPKPIGGADLFNNTSLGSDDVYAIGDMVVAQSGKLDVEMHIHNICMFDASKNYQCFRLDVYLNGQKVARFIASPGDPDNNVDFNGSNTPEMTNRNITRINKAGYTSHRGDPMPHAMHIDWGRGGYAVHGSGLKVDGEKASHGCVRLKKPDAAKLNSWARRARDTGGMVRVTIEHTELNYKKGQHLNNVGPRTKLQEALDSGVGGLF